MNCFLNMMDGWEGFFNETGSSFWEIIKLAGTLSPSHQLPEENNHSILSPYVLLVANISSPFLLFIATKAFAVTQFETNK